MVPMTRWFIALVASVHTGVGVIVVASVPVALPMGIAWPVWSGLVCAVAVLFWIAVVRTDMRQRTARVAFMGSAALCLVWSAGAAVTGLHDGALVVVAVAYLGVLHARQAR